MTWSDERANPRDTRPRRWLADSRQSWRPSKDPELSEAQLETFTDAQLANLLNVLGWPVLPTWDP